jgi:hypothetical protein
MNNSANELGRKLNEMNEIILYLFNMVKNIEKKTNIL